MSRATLEITPAPAIREDAREVLVDCPHGATSVTILPAPNVPAATMELLCVRLALVKHHDAERCWCTQELRQRYGVA